jgi:hypothetical protein
LCTVFAHFKSNEKDEALQTNLQLSLICTATPAFIDSTDWKRINAKFIMTTQKKHKKEPRAAILDQYLLIDATCDPP